MSQGHRSSRRPRRREPLDRADDVVGHPAVRVIPRELVAHTIAANETSPDASSPHALPAVVRPRRARDVRDVAPRLRAHRPVVLELDQIEDDAQRRRAMDFVTGLAYGLEAAMSSVAHRKHAFLLEPIDGSSRRREVEQGTGPRTAPEQLVPPDASPQNRERVDNAQPPPRAADSAALCVLCDLRQADEAFDTPLDMVIRRDGTRIHSPAALVCAHCRSTITHWRFAIGWCPECERWGRRSVMSPCGMPYGA